MTDLLATLTSFLEKQALVVQPPCTLSMLEYTGKCLWADFRLFFPPDLKKLLIAQNGILSNDFVILPIHSEGTPGLDERTDLLAANHFYHQEAGFSENHLLIGTSDFGLIIHDQSRDEFQLVDERNFQSFDTHATLSSLLEEILGTIEENSGNT